MPSGCASIRWLPELAPFVCVKGTSWADRKHYRSRAVCSSAATIAYERTLHLNARLTYRDAGVRDGWARIGHTRPGVSSACLVNVGGICGVLDCGAEVVSPILRARPW